MSQQYIQEQLTNSLRHIRNVYFVFILVISVAIYTHHAAIKESVILRTEYIKLNNDITTYIDSQHDSTKINVIFPHFLDDVKHATQNNITLYFNIIKQNGINITYDNKLLDKIVNSSCKFYVYDLGMNTNQKLYEIQDLLNNYEAMALAALPASTYGPFKGLNKDVNYTLIDTQVKWEKSNRFDIEYFVPERPTYFTFSLSGMNNSTINIQAKATVSPITKVLNKDVIINQYPIFSARWDEVKNYSLDELQNLSYATNKMLDLEYRFEAFGVKIRITNLQYVCWFLTIGLIFYIATYTLSLEKNLFAHNNELKESHNTILLPWVGMHKHFLSSIFSALVHIAPAYLFFLEKNMGLIQNTTYYCTILIYILLITINETWTQKLLKNVNSTA